MPTNVAPPRMVISSQKRIFFGSPSWIAAYALTIDTLEQISRNVLKAVIVLNIKITAFNTFLLICSSVSMVKADAAIQDGDPKKMRFWLLMTILGGAEIGRAAGR